MKTRPLCQDNSCDTVELLKLKLTFPCKMAASGNNQSSLSTRPRISVTEYLSDFFKKFCSFCLCNKNAKNGFQSHKYHISYTTGVSSNPILL